eukprot:COSAG06_NODE_16925_length_972_cov_2.651775_2_plen_71_part_00
MLVNLKVAMNPPVLRISLVSATPLCALIAAAGAQVAATKRNRALRGFYERSVCLEIYPIGCGTNSLEIRT